MTSPLDGHWEKFAGRELTEWTRPELIELDRVTPGQSPKIALILAVLDDAGVSSPAELDAEALGQMYRDLGLVKFGGLGSVMKSLADGLPGPKSPSEDQD